MNASRWLRIKDLFRQAHDLPAAERSVFLEQQCDDAGVRREVLGLLAADDDAEGSPCSSNAPRASAEPASPTVEGVVEQIGPYRLLERIGEGGFGTVYMAEQTQPLRRRVALKIIKPGMDTREVVARFEQERQALALMDHPYIASVLDAGATHDGRPFVVMELVRGVPISEFCDTQNLSIRRRLELFCLVCDAVQHAHQKGVIHRDLKPSNILVAQVDGRPHPKVIDFGIAKALREPLTDRTLFTRFQQMVGTPQYMSPEQVDGSLDVDTRGDVYSLGVVLYELLTGLPPLDVHRLGSMGEVQRVIKEVDPPRPSTRLGLVDSVARPRPDTAENSVDDSRVAALPDAPAVVRQASSIVDIARLRQTDAGTLLKQVRGEPDWIVMRALEKDRSRRYESVAAMAADVRRHLADEPILAGPPSRWYRARKLVRRHRTLVAAAAVVVVSLVVGMVVAGVGLYRASAALGREQIAARTARQVQGVLEQALTAANPFDATEPDLRVRDLLDRTAATLDQSLADQPEVEASVRVTMSLAYRGLGATDEAMREARRAIQLRRDAGVRDVLMGEAVLVLGRIQLAAMKYADAEPLVAEAVSIFDVVAPDAGHLGQALMTRADFRQQTGDVPGAIVDLDHAERVIMSGSPPERALIVMLLVNRGRVHERSGDLAAAEQSFRQAIALQRELAEADHAREIFLISALNGLGNVLSVRGDYDGAVQTAGEAAEIMRRRLGDEHPEVATALSNLATVQRDKGDLDAAEENARRAYRIRQKALPKDHALVFFSLSQLGALAASRGEHKEAARLFRRSIEGRRRAIGDADPYLCTELSNLAAAYMALGQAGESEQYATEALEAARRAFGDGHPRTIDAMGELATHLAARRKFRQAEPLIREALAGNRRHFGDRHIQVARDLATLAMILEELGEKSDAEAAYRQSIALAREIKGPDFPDLPSPMCNLCAMLNDDGRSAEAEPILREALRIAELAHPAGSPNQLRAMMGLGVALTRTKRAGEAEPMLREVLQLRERAMPATSPVLAHTRGALGECLAELGNYSDAESLLRGAQTFFESLRGRGHPHTLEQCDRLARLYTLWGRREEAAQWRAVRQGAASQPKWRVAE